MKCPTCGEEMIKRVSKQTGLDYYKCLKSTTDNPHATLHRQRTYRRRRYV